jgi:hypothetical protein
MIINNSLFKLPEIPDKQYYVYAYYDENNIPIYIGMGKGNRIKSHIQTSTIKSNNKPFYEKMKESFKSGKNIYFKILKDGLTRNEASLIEETLIALLGRQNKNDGILLNQSRGGVNAPIEPLLRKVAVYDYNTSELIKTFDSINSCAIFIKGNKNTVRDALVGKYATTTSTGTFFIEDYDELTNKYTNLKEQLINRKKEREIKIVEAVSRPIKFINITTKETKKFETSYKAQEYFNCCTKTLKKCINNNTLFRKEWEVYFDK